MTKISLHQYRSLECQNHGKALGLLECIKDKRLVEIMGVEHYAKKAAEILEENERNKALEIDYTK